MEQLTLIQPEEQTKEKNSLALDSTIKPVIFQMEETLRLLSDEDRIEAINQIKLLLHEISPMKNEPVDCVLWVRNNLVGANDYNPNSVAPPEMELLKLSIMADGYTQPIVAFKEENGFTVVDGFHRNRVGKECKEVTERVKGYLPITVIREDREDRSDRIAATIRHNRARGKHKIDAMSDIVIELKKRNKSDKWIAEQLGMEPDEVLRLAQISGLAEMFKDREFSKAWEPEFIDDKNGGEMIEDNKE